MTASESAVHAIITEVGKRIPTLDELTSIADPSGMGPDVTIPAIWMSIILLHIRNQAGTIALRDTEARGSLSLRATPANSDDMAEYAGALASHATATFDGDRIEAAGSLFQAGAAILIATLTRDAAVAAMSNLSDFFKLDEVLGTAETVQ